MSRALVTGASGFVGAYLIQNLLTHGYEVIAGVHGPEDRMPPGCRRVELDVTDRQTLGKAIAGTQPDEVYHLAGLSRPASGAVEEFHGVNFGGALNLLESVREHAPEAGVLLVGSAYAYGKVDHPIAETQPLEPVNHYGVSKAAAEMLGRVYVLEGLRVIMARPFNHSGPGQSPDFVLPSLVRQFAEIKAGKQEPVVRLGNLDSVRDLSDARDIVGGYRLALRRGRSGEAYNFGSGRGMTVKEIYETVLQEAEVEVNLVTEPARQRPADIPFLVADASKAREELGWETRISLGETIRDMIAADLGELEGVHGAGLQE